MILYVINATGTDHHKNMIGGILTMDSTYDDVLSSAFYTKDEIEADSEKAQHLLTFYSHTRAETVCDIFQEKTNLVSSVSIKYSVITYRFTHDQLISLASQNCNRLKIGVVDEVEEEIYDW